MFQTKFRSTVLLPLVSTFIFTACGTQTPSSSESKIVGGSDAVTDTNYVVALQTSNRFCTGTIISAKSVLTAAHCLPVAGQTQVLFYGYNGLPNGQTAGVTRVAFPDGVDPFASDYIDSRNVIGDLAVLILDSSIPSDKKPASTESYYRGKDQSVFAIGRGQHDGNSNGSGIMRWAQTRTQSPDDNNGLILTQKAVTNSGDSGGPLFRYEGQTPYIIGVLKGELGSQSAYTSVGKHASFIIKNQYSW